MTERRQAENKVAVERSQVAASNFQTVLEKALEPPFERKPGGWIKVNDERLANALAEALPAECVHQSENLFTGEVNGIPLEWIARFALDIHRQLREDHRRIRTSAVSLTDVVHALMETPADELKAEIVARCLE